jgi:competence protein ComEC
MAAALVWFSWCLWKTFYQKQALVLPILLFISLGYLSIQPWVSPRLPANHILRFSDDHRRDITGQVVNIPRRFNNRTRFYLQVASIEGDGRKALVCGKLRVTAFGDLPALARGDRVQFNGRIRPLTNFKNPGGFDYKQYMAFKGIRATAYVNRDELVVIDTHAVSGVGQFLEDLRRRYAGLIDQSGHTQSQGVLKALIIGDRSQISAETRQAFNRAGVGHLLAISGLHIGIVATVAFSLFQWLMARFNFFLWWAWSRKGAALLSLMPVFAYGMIAGFTPSTQRAVCMVSIFLLTFLVEREQDPFNTLALAALVILVADPPSLFSISFQLSFVTVLAIIYGMSRVKFPAAIQPVPPKNDRRLRFASRLISFFLVSFFAVCGSLPLVAVYFNQISLVGLIANFVVVPLVGFFAVPFGLIALFVSSLSSTVAFWCIQAGSGILTIALAVVQFFADLPFAAVKTFTPSLLEIGCYYLLCWSVLNLYRSPRTSAATQPSDEGAAAESPNRNLKMARSVVPVRLIKFLGILGVLEFKKFSRGYSAIIILVLVLITLAADAGYWFYQRFGNADLRVTVIDVGHGSASLLEYPGGYTMLIDGGGFADNSAFDVGAAIVAPLLWRKKIRTVDGLILSHPNSDHLNGLIYIARHFHVKKIWTNSEARNTQGYKDLMRVIAIKKIALPAFADTLRNHRINGVELEFLYPPRDFLKRKETEKWRNLNNNSLVVKVSLHTTSFLFPGDIMAAAEKELVGIAGRNLNSTVLIAPHHGSRSSSSTIFLKQVNPDVVVISSGRQGRFKLPHPKILKRYQDHGYTIFRTDINGAIALSTDGLQLEVEPFIAF